MTTRRAFLGQSAFAAGVTFLPFVASADGHAANTFETPAGPLTVHPISHASFVMETPNGTIYVDPVGDRSLYGRFRQPDLILITHEHGDHYNEETLLSINGEVTTIFTNPAVYEKLPNQLRRFAAPMENDGTNFFNAVGVRAVPAYNTTEGRLNYHPQGRDNGYILYFNGFTVYISGDTEDIPEMRALTDIDLAFVCMNLPWTMDAEAAASAVNEFAPTYCYPYHYRGRDNGTQDPQEFADMLNATQAKFGPWYG